MENIKPIETAELLYKTQNQQFKYSWYYYYKLICKNQNEYTEIGALIAISLIIKITTTVLKTIKEYKNVVPT